MHILLKYFFHLFNSVPSVSRSESKRSFDSEPQYVQCMGILNTDLLQECYQYIDTHKKTEILPGLDQNRMDSCWNPLSSILAIQVLTAV